MNNVIKRIEIETLKFLDEPIILIGNSKAFNEVLEKAVIYANCDENVSIYGETGTGKTELAKAIHCLSPRREFPFVHFDCGLLSESLSEGELFGHKKGAFTGAIENRIGLLESANKGTFLIDEIGNLPQSLQVKFLKVTQEKRIRRVGDNKEIKIDVRFIIATHRDLKKGVKERWFREDLYARLNVLEIKIPPLRERKEDILELADYKLFQLNRKYKMNKSLSSGVNDYLLSYFWPENIRELNNAITRAYFNAKDIIGIESFPEEIRNANKGNSNRENSNSKIKNLFIQLIEGKKDFWQDIRQAFLNRDLNREEVKELIKIGLHQNGGKYKELSKKFNCDYNKFMAFLRHHDLKP